MLIDYSLGNITLPMDSQCCKIYVKSARKLNVLKRIGNYMCRQEKLSILHTLIFAKFNFRLLAWHFCIKRWKRAQTNSKICS